MSHNTFAVIALDAADYELAKRWECENLLLDTSHSLETFAYTHSFPHTIEVWPTVATGLPPEEHGCLPEQIEESWNSNHLQLASSITSHILPKWVRTKIGEIIWEHENAERTKTPTQTDAEHVFDEVKGWPGITPAKNLTEAWRLAGRVNNGHLTDTELAVALFELFGEEMGYLLGHAVHGEAGVIGVHSHILDIAGHTYAKHPEVLQVYYEQVNDVLGVVRNHVDYLLVLSDHGMCVQSIDDEGIGDHSFRALIAGTETIEDDLPTDISEVANWLTKRDVAATDDSGIAVSDTAEERLEDLGYV